MLNKCDSIVNKARSRCRNNRFKSGIEVLITVEDDLSIDWGKGITLWNDSIGKDMRNYRVAFNLIDRDNHAPDGYKDIT